MERWKLDIDHEVFYPPALKGEHAPSLTVAARDHINALAAASPDTIERLLVEMRSSCHRRSETEAEARASFAVIIQALAEYPEDLIREAVKLYVTDPNERGARFFPRSPSELLRYAAPLLKTRQNRRTNLIRMAQLARKAKDEEDRLNTPPEAIPDHEVARWQRSMAETALRKGWIPQEQFERLFPELDTTTSPALGYDAEPTGQ